MDISIEHPTDRPNFSIVRIGDVSLAFSYKTLIGICEPFSSWRVSENVWSATTGKHLNYLNSDKGERLEREKFLALVDSLEVELKGVHSDN